MFNTVLHQLADPGNVGMILRAHAAFGGNRLILTGNEKPFTLNKKFRNTSRSMYKHIPIDEFATFADFKEQYASQNAHIIGIEITEEAINLPEFSFPENSFLVLGSERFGLPDEVIEQCDSIVKIPHYGQVGSMNVAMAASIAMYECTRGKQGIKPVYNRMYNFKSK